MADFAIRTEGLGKKYRIDHDMAGRARTNTFRDAIMNQSRQVARRLGGWGRSRPRIVHEDFWALREIDLEIGSGEVVGVIGRNGAGKSTLLKLLSRITEPSEGRILIRGRIASLLEVGTGFHPELTGRENIYLNGAILGMGRQEIRRKFDEIVAFSEVDRFLDTPVKRYSSGMYVRLAFAVAAHLEPEILLVDEVLAVGDVQFQRKCIGKMEQVGQAGRTVVFVSHNMSLVNNLCQRGVLLKGGRLAAQGPVDEIVAAYLEQSNGGEGPEAAGAGTDGPLVKDPDIDILSFQACDPQGGRRTLFRTSEPVAFRIEYEVKREQPGLRIGFDLVNTVRGETLFRTYDDDMGEQDRRPGRRTVVCTIPQNLLMAGVYAANLAVSVHRVRWISHQKIAERITVEHVDGVNSRYADPRPGAIMPQLQWDHAAGASTDTQAK